VAVETCPADLVHAPVDKVWSLLAQPSQYDRWWDAHTTRIDPEGPAAPGQTVCGWTTAIGRRWAVSLQIEAVAPERHQIRLRTKLPLGINPQHRDYQPLSCSRG
jgi:uncharacterized protein YndB with AHSA1/START domain